jgi:hypothetical protein
MFDELQEQVERPLINRDGDGVPAGLMADHV